MVFYLRFMWWYFNFIYFNC